MLSFASNDDRDTDDSGSVWWQVAVTAHMLSVINSSIVENAVNPRLMLLMRIILIAICCQWIQIYKNQMIFYYICGR